MSTSEDQREIGEITEKSETKTLPTSVRSEVTIEDVNYIQMPDDEEVVPDEIYDKFDGITIDPDRELDILKIQLKDGVPEHCVAAMDEQYNEGDHIFLHTFDHSMTDGPEKDYIMKQMMNDEFAIDTPAQALIFVLNLKEHIRRLQDGERNEEEKNAPVEPQISDVTDETVPLPTAVAHVVNEVEDRHQKHMDTLDKFREMLDQERPKISTEMMMDVLPLYAAYPEYEHGFNAFTKYALFSIQQRAHKRDMPALVELLESVRSIRQQLEECEERMKECTSE